MPQPNISAAIITPRVRIISRRQKISAFGAAPAIVELDKTTKVVVVLNKIRQ